MAQSESSDFEFDVSNLEVEGEKSSIPGEEDSVSSEDVEVEGVDVPSQPKTPKGGKPANVPDDEWDAEAAAGFDLDELPSVFASEQASVPLVEPQSEEDVTGAAVPMEEPEIELPKPSRRAAKLPVGEDDLGADLLSEIESDGGSLSFDDVLDDLLDEVDSFEVGIGDDTEASSASEVLDGEIDPFNLEDPDDSLTAKSGVKPYVPVPPRPKSDLVDLDHEELLEFATSEASTPARPHENRNRRTPVSEIPADEMAVEVEAEASQIESPPSPSAESVVTSSKKTGRGSENVWYDAAAEAEKDAQAKQATGASPEPVFSPNAEAGPETGSIDTIPEAADDELVAADTISEGPLAEEPGSPEESEKSASEARETVWYDAAQEDAGVESSEEQFEVEAGDPEGISDEESAPVIEETVEEPMGEAEAEELPVDEPILEIPADDAFDEIAESDVSPASDASSVAPEDAVLETSGDLEEIESTETEASSGPPEDLGEEAVEELGASEDLAQPESDLIDSEASDVEADLDVLADAISETSEAFEQEEEEADVEIEAEASDDSEAAESVDETESVSVPDAFSGLTEVEEEESTDEAISMTPEDEANSNSEEDEEEVSEILSAEELLKQAGSLLNGEVLDDSSDDEDEPESLIAEDESLEEISAAETAPSDDTLSLDAIDSILDDAETESLEEIAAEEAPVSSGLDVIDDEESIAEDDDDEVVQMPSLSEVSGLMEVDEDEIEEEDDEEVTPLLSAEELLKQAGGLLNGEPADAASALLDEEDEELDDDEVVAMPSLESLMGEVEDVEESSEDDDDDEGVMVLPDPLSMMEEAGQGEADGEAPKSGNVADRGGDLPPPPPAPVEIIDDDPLEEDPQGGIDAILAGFDEEVEAAESEVEKSEEPAQEEAAKDPFDDPFGTGDELDGLSLDPDDADALEEALSQEAEQEREEQERATASPKEVIVEMPKPSLLWRVTHSMTIAAGLVLIGAAWLLSSWKQEIMEFWDGRDIDGSALVLELREMSTHVMDGFENSGLYRMQWVDSEVKQVSSNEMRVYARVGAQLRENLYEPVFDSDIEKRFHLDETPMHEVAAYAEKHFPNLMGAVPERPWDTLFQLTTAKGKIVPLELTYRLLREKEHDDWEFAGVRVRGYKGDLEWPPGRPREEFGDRAFDVDSPEFATALQRYQQSADQFVARMEQEKNSLEAEEAMLALDNKRRRERVLMSLAQGAFFRGVAILGEDGDEAQDVTMVVTEIRDGGALIKGVFKVDDSQEFSKHFVGTVDFVTGDEGYQHGQVNLTTIAIDENAVDEPSSPFFASNTTSRIRLKADGFRLEGDNRDLSLRLSRSQ